MGVQIHGYLTDVQWNQMVGFSKTLGVNWIKVQFQWKELEPDKGNFNSLYAAMVLNVQRAHLAGFKTMISIAKAPGWSRPAAVVNQDDGPPTNPQDLADFVTKMTTDIKPEFLDAVEVSNEPNLIRQWRGATLIGETYMQYFNASYTAIQNVQKSLPAADHRIIVISRESRLPRRLPVSRSMIGTTCGRCMRRDWRSTATMWASVRIPTDGPTRRIKCGISLTGRYGLV